MIFGYNNRLSATVLINTISSDQFIKRFQNRDFIDNLDYLDILMVSSYFINAVQREKSKGILDLGYVIELPSVISAVKKHGKDSFDYHSATKLNSGIKEMNKDEIIELLKLLKESSAYQHYINDLKEYVGTDF